MDDLKVYLGGGGIALVLLLIKIFAKPLVGIFNKFMNNVGGKLVEQQDIREDRQKNIEWLRTKLLEEENAHKTEIHSYKEEINNLVKKNRELNLDISETQGQNLILESEKKILDRENERLNKEIERLRKKYEDD